MENDEEAQDHERVRAATATSHCIRMQHVECAHALVQNAVHQIVLETIAQSKSSAAIFASVAMLSLSL